MYRELSLCSVCNARRLAGRKASEAVLDRSLPTLSDISLTLALVQVTVRRVSKKAEHMYAATLQLGRQLAHQAGLQMPFGNQSFVKQFRPVYRVFTILQVCANACSHSSALSNSVTSVLSL